MVLPVTVYCLFDVCLSGFKSRLFGLEIVRIDNIVPFGGVCTDLLYLEVISSMCSVKRLEFGGQICVLDSCTSWFYWALNWEGLGICFGFACQGIV